jgi:hypothetical protein
MDTWELIKKIYQEKLNIPQDVIEYVAIMDILKLCACGYCNKHISRVTKHDIQYIESVLADIFSFDGFSSDLDFSPIAIYNKCNNKLVFYNELTVISDRNAKLVEFLYTLCSKYAQIKSYVDKYWSDSK